MFENKFADADDKDAKGICVLMVIIPFLFFLPLVINEKKNNSYLKHYSNQCLLLLITDIVLRLILPLLFVVPVISGILQAIIYIFLFVIFIILLIGALKGTDTKIPLIGSIHILDK